jgi:hypothetical protein
MDNANFNARGRDFSPMMMPSQARFNNQSFRAEGRMTMPEARMTMPEVRMTMPEVRPMTPAVDSKITPFVQPATSNITPVSTAVFESVASVTRLVPNSIQQPTSGALQSGIALPSSALSTPPNVSTSQGAGGLLTLPGGKLEGSSTIVQTDSTPRPIVRFPAAGPATTVHLKSSEIAGFTFVISSNRYAISLDDHPGSYIRGEGGTAFEVTSAGVVVIKEGVALIASGADPLTVRTRLADVRIGPDSVALVEAGNFGPCKVAALKSSADESILVSLASGGDSDKDNIEVIGVPGSTELVVADHQLTPEELVSSDGVDREYRRTLLKSSSWHVVRAGLPIANLIAHHPLLVAASGDQQLALSPAIRVLFREHHDKLQKPLPPEKQATVDDLIGISYTAPAALPGLRATRHASVFAHDQGHYKLQCGTIFIDAEQALRIDTPTSSVFAAPHSALVISADDSRTQVLNLHDRRAGAVKLLVGKTYVPLGPGAEARVLKERSVKARPLALGDGIGRRSMRVVPTAENLNVVVNEFSIPDALLAHPVLKQFSASHNAPDRTLVNKIVKTAAAVAFATAGSREVYSSAAVR